MTNILCLLSNCFTATLAAQGTMQQISKPRPANENIQPKQPTSRPLNILPSNAANIRPASSVSTQTIMGAQQPVCIRFCGMLVVFMFAATLGHYGK